MSELLTLKAVADLLKVHTQTLYHWRNHGKITFVKVGGRNRITRDEVERFLNPQPQPPK